jgi:hypothetical protein
MPIDKDVVDKMTANEMTGVEMPLNKILVE